jgi:hypothetical protein
MQLEFKKALAKALADVKEGEAAELTQEQSDYFDRVFGTKNKKPQKRTH